MKKTTLTCDKCKRKPSMKTSAGPDCKWLHVDTSEQVYLGDDGTETYRCSYDLCVKCKKLVYAVFPQDH